MQEGRWKEELGGHLELFMGYTSSVLATPLELMIQKPELVRAPQGGRPPPAVSHRPLSQETA